MQASDAQIKTLFSRYYLETRLPGHPEWAEAPRLAFDAVRVLQVDYQLCGLTEDEKAIVESQDRG